MNEEQKNNITEKILKPASGKSTCKACSPYRGDSERFRKTDSGYQSCE